MVNELLDLQAPVGKLDIPVPCALLVEDPKEHFFYVRKISAACYDLLGLTQEDAGKLDGSAWYRYIHPGDFEKLRLSAKEMAENPTKENAKSFFMMRIKRLGKRTYDWVGGYLNRGTPIDGHNTLYCIFFTQNDIEFMDRQMWADMVPGRTIVRSVLDNLETPVFWKDAHGRFLGANEAFFEYFGMKNEDIVGKTSSVMKNLLPDTSACAVLERSLLSGEVGEFRKTIHVIQKGKLREVNISYGPLTNNGKTIGLVGSFIDVTEANEAQRVLEKLASFDYLTGMKNRRMFFQTLNAAAKEYQSGGEDFAVLMMDLDSFKEINDTFGHDVGDQILIEFSQKATEILKGRGELYRLGGDEFITLIPFEEKNDVLALKDEIQGRLTSTFDADGHELKVACSIGFAIFGDYLDTDILMREADRWMYRDKFLKKAKR